MSKVFSIRLDEELIPLLDRVANDKGITRNRLINIALWFYVKHYIKAKKSKKA